MPHPVESIESVVDDFAARGFVVVDNVVPNDQIMTLRASLAGLANDESVRRRGSSSYGIRNLLRLAPEVCDFAHRAVLRAIVDPLAGTDARPVRGIYFDKTPDANWKVSWHQDLSIAVRQQRDVAGFSGWSIKAGVPHVQPPVNILARMLTVRLHLDDTTEENGALRVIAGSHHRGRLDADAIQQIVERMPAEVCPVARGSAFVMRPLLLHASSAAVTPSHRRVVHIEFSPDALPDGLEWHGS